MKMIRLCLIALITMLILSGCMNYVMMPDLTLGSKNYPKPEDISSLSFALAQPSITVATDLTRTANGGLIDRIKNDTSKVSCHLTGEVQKILLSKGFTITDTFDSYNDMTFTQKRNTSALFYPEIRIDIDEKSQLDTWSFLIFGGRNINGRMEINATVNIVMLEPLSGEKLWIKSLPVKGIDDLVHYTPAIYGGPQLNGVAVPQNLQPIAGKIDNMFEQISKEVLLATNKYVERSEFEFLNKDIERLKQIKRY